MVEGRVEREDARQVGRGRSDVKAREETCRVPREYVRVAGVAADQEGTVYEGLGRGTKGQASKVSQNLGRDASQNWIC